MDFGKETLLLDLHLQQIGFFCVREQGGGILDGLESVDQFEDGYA